MDDIPISQEKIGLYIDLVNKRKDCRLCLGLTNPADVDNGHYDRDHIGPWSTWQGNINSPIVVIGQDWGSPEVFRHSKGLEPYCSENDRNTNGMLVDLLGSIGIKIERPNGRHETTGKLFFTNAILCLKHGDAQAPVKDEWFQTCGIEFIVPLLLVLEPFAVITLGEKAYRALELLFRLNKTEFRSVVNDPAGIPLFEKTRLFPMYHCGRRILNTHRKLDQQLKDWARVGKYLRECGVNVP